MTDERADRMAGRFGSSDEDDEPDQQDQQEAKAEAPQEDEPEDKAAADDSDESTEKITDRPVLQIYSEEEIRDDIEDLFKDLEYVYNRKRDEEFTKHRDFYPALLRAGLNNIFEELDVDEDDVPRL